MPVCAKKNIKESQSLGEILTGESIYITDYEANLLQNEYCKLLCAKKFKEFDVNLFKWMVEHEYVSSWYLDDLPAGRNLTMYGEKSEVVLHESGIPIGHQTPDKKHMIYNHYTFNIYLNKDVKKNSYSIVEFSIVPFRYNYQITLKFFNLKVLSMK